MSGGGGDGYAHILELGAGAAFFFGAGVALDDFTEFADAGIFLAEFKEGHAFLEVGGSELEAFRIVVDDLVVFLNGSIIIFLRVGDFAEPELGVGGEVRVAVILEVVLKFGVGEIVFATGEIAEAVGIERVGGRRTGRTGRGRRAVGGRAGSAGRSASARGSGGGSAAGETRVDALDGVLQIDELLIEFADAGFDFLEIVGEALDLSGHGVETRAGVGLDVLDGFLEGGHGGVELVDGIGGLLDEGFLDGVVLSHLGLNVFLTLEERGDVALEFDNFASDSEGRFRADETAGDGADEHGAGKERDVTHTHEKPPEKTWDEDG